MKCEQCGAEHEASTRFCVYCGSRVPEPRLDRRPDLAEKQGPTTPLSFTLPKRWPLVFTGIAAVILCIGAVAVVLLVTLVPDEAEKVALAAFEEHAEATGIPYRSASARTLESDSAFAQVRVQAEFRHSPDAPWLEKEATIALRRLGDEWLVDSSFNFTLTERQRQRITAEHQSAMSKALETYLLTSGTSHAQETRFELLGFEIVDVQDTSGGGLLATVNIAAREHSLGVAAVEKAGSLTLNLVGEEWRVQGELALALTPEAREALLTSYRGAIILSDVSGLGDSLYLVSEGADQPARLFSAPGIYLARWSPDGESLLVVFTDGGYRSAFVARGTEILVLSGAMPQDLADKTWHPPTDASADEEQGQPTATGLSIDTSFADWSPTGEYVLLAEGNPQVNRFYTVKLEDLTYEETGYFSRLNLYLGWLPDGQRVAFIADMMGGFGIESGTDLSISYGQTVEGSLTSGSSNYWAFNGRREDTVYISMEAAYGSDLDTYVCLYGPDGENLTCDDDGGSNYNSLISYYALPHDGQYRIQARSYSGSGSYRLALSSDSTAAAANLYLFDALTGQSEGGFDDPDRVFSELEIQITIEAIEDGAPPRRIPPVFDLPVLSGMYWNPVDLVFAAPASNGEDQIAFAAYGGGVTYGEPMMVPGDVDISSGVRWTSAWDQVLFTWGTYREENNYGGIGITDYPVGTTRVFFETTLEDLYSLLPLPSPSGEHCAICAIGGADKVFIMRLDGSVVSELQGTCVGGWYDTQGWDTNGEHLLYYDEEGESIVIARVDGAEVAQWLMSEFKLEHVPGWTRDDRYFYLWSETEDVLTLNLYDAQSFDVVQRVTFPSAVRDGYEDVYLHLDFWGWKP